MNLFSATILQFHSRPKFELAIVILEKLETEVGENLLDVGYSDMILSVYSSLGLQLVLGELAVHQIWDKPSFHGPADFEVIKDIE